MSSSVSIVNLLLDKGADALIQDKNKFTPMVLAHAKIIIFKPEDQTDELISLEKDVKKVFEILASQVVKQENGKKLLGQNLFINPSRLRTKSIDEIQRVQNNLRLSFKPYHPFL